MMFCQRKQRLLALMDHYTEEDLILAFSGGVDSALLLQVACQCAQSKKRTVHAVTFQTTLHPAREQQLTRDMARTLGASYQLLAVDELQQAGIAENPEDRCYRCKHYLFSELHRVADAMGLDRIMDGTNADDLHLHRPGLKALAELHILSPLAEAGMGKSDVRRLAAEYGLAVAERPSTPCLATRFPYGTTLRDQDLRRVEQAEQFLTSLGFTNLRLRVHGEVARLEIEPGAFADLLRHREQVLRQLQQLGYRYITLDLAGFRSGSMDNQ